MRVLIVGPDISPARAASRALRKSGIACDLARDAEDGLEYARAYEYDAVLLSVGTADPAGATLLRELRRSDRGAPVLAFADDADPMLRVTTLELGADDVLSAPFHEREVQARLAAVVRRSRGIAAPVLVAGPITFDTRSRQVLVDNRPVHLTRKEQAILEMLMLRRGAVLGKATMMDRLYGMQDAPEPKTLEVLICKLRKKLGAAGDVIRTVWGQGYTVARAAPAEMAAAA